ncbi:MAG: XdhC family protein [Gemmatales bacterium]|nr:XdhC family protein [Gemmatales bacterium]MDW8175467.1 XdhC family protein [Gemmatales bacterium]
MLREVLAATVRALESGTPAVLCSLVETRGSTPQKPGAAMLLFADGRQVGTLGGGCVEAEVKQRAWRCTDPHRPELLVFHLDHDYGWDDGLICGGRMTIAVQALLGEALHVSGLREYFHRALEHLSHGSGGLEVIALHPRDGFSAGARWLLDREHRVVAQLHAQALPPELVPLLPRLQPLPRPQSREGFAMVPLAPRIRLLIVGAGHVGQAVARLAQEADFAVWVLDDREAYANRERFPHAERILVGPLAPVLEHLRAHDITPHTYCLIVTRGHHHDEEALYYLAPSRAAYVGMIGSRRKIRLIFEDLLARGIAEDVLRRVKAPIGLNIGSQTVAEIAISVVAELIAVRNLGAAEAEKLRHFEPVWPTGTSS